MPLALQALQKARTVEMIPAATGADGRRFGRVFLEADGAFGVCDRKQALLLLLELAVGVVLVDEYRLSLPVVERRAEQIAEQRPEHRHAAVGRRVV